jgi:hypothetical protein
MTYILIGISALILAPFVALLALAWMVAHGEGD